jgi:hypothetical protein
VQSTAPKPNTFVMTTIPFTKRLKQFSLSRLPGTAPLPMGQDSSAAPASERPVGRKNLEISAQAPIIDLSFNMISASPW